MSDKHGFGDLSSLLPPSSSPLFLAIVAFKHKARFVLEMVFSMACITHALAFHKKDVKERRKNGKGRESKKKRKRNPPDL